MALANRDNEVQETDATVRAYEAHGKDATGEVDKKELFVALSLTDEEKASLYPRLWELLGKQAFKYNGMESSSLTTEEAEKVLESMMFTLEVAIDEGVTREEVLYGSLPLLLNKGQKIIDRKRREVRVEWFLMMKDLPKIRNQFFISTMGNLELFFVYYDMDFGAHQIPCSIDYWPMIEMNDELKGVKYVEEYVRRIQIENDFLNFFDTAMLDRLYRKHIGSYRDELFNLCYPVLSRTIGIEIYNLYISGDEREKIALSELFIYREQLREISKFLEDRDELQIRDIINCALIAVCEEMGIRDKEDMKYLYDATSGLEKRLFEAAGNGEVYAVFS